MNLPAETLIQPIVDDYELAAEILDTEGWCQGTFGVPNSTSCLAGAIRKAVVARLDLGWIPVFEIDWQSVNRDTQFSDLVDKAPRALVDWNDTPGRTKEQVQDRLIEAAKRRRNEGR